MARTLNRLSAVAVKAIAPGKYADGGGLWLHKREDGGGQFFLRYTIHGRRRELGLGALNQVTLKEAREAAEKWRAVVRAGNDPIRERQKQRRESAHSLHLLKDVADDAFESRKAELKDDGNAGRWFSPIKHYVLPKLGKVPVADIDQLDIRDTLSPIWHLKGDTARKAMGRLQIIMRHAAALGLDVDLQAVDKARALLGKSRYQTQNIPAMNWRDVPGFYASLSEGSVTHLGLRLLILTGVRSRPVRFIRDEQIKGDIWTIPAEMMKGRKGATSNFRVPLSSAAMAVIAQARRLARDGFLFPNVRKGVLADATLSRLMERRDIADRPHGFRSSLRTWIAETTNAPYEVAETVLGHVVGSKVQRAYQRTDFLEHRRELMEKWGSFCAGNSGQVLMLTKTAVG